MSPGSGFDIARDSKDDIIFNEAREVTEVFEGKVHCCTISNPCIVKILFKGVIKTG